MKINKIFKNASWIIGCKIVQSLLGLIVSMLTARYLGPSNFGVISYAISVVSFVIPIMQLGLNNIIVKEFVDYPEKEGEILGSAILMSTISALVCMFGVGSFTILVNAGETETIIVCVLYSFILIFQALELSQYWFQAKLRSKYSAIVSLVAYLIVTIYKIILLIFNKSIYWFAISNAIDYMLIAVSLLIIYRKLGGHRLSFSKTVAKRMFLQGRYYIVSSLMVTIFAQTDRIMIKLMIDDASTGYYSAAISCAGLTSFVFSAVIDSFRPQILESYQENIFHFEKNVSRLYAIVIYLALGQSVFMTLFSKIIIGVLYGDAYVPAVTALQIVVWYTTFSYIGSVRNIWILAEQKQKYLWIINLSGAIINVILNYILIPILGINGAAVASLATQIFANVIIGFIIKPIRKNNFLMFKGLNPILFVRKKEGENNETIRSK